MIVDLPFIWAMLIAIAVLMYVVLDGFDLGIGILFPAIKGERNRDVMMKSIAPVWDGNETWLVPSACLPGWHWCLAMVFSVPAGL